MAAAAVIASLVAGTAVADEAGVPTEASVPAFAPGEVLTQDLPEDACMEELRRCCCSCCPGWSHYAIFDVLFLQRNAQIGNAPLVFNADTNLPVMTAQDLQPGIGTGRSVAPVASRGRSSASM